MCIFGLFVENLGLLWGRFLILRYGYFGILVIYRIIFLGMGFELGYVGW